MVSEAQGLKLGQILITIIKDFSIFTGRILRECDADLKAIIDYNSLFFSEAELLKQFDSISSISGTHIIIYTLAK